MTTANLTQSASLGSRTTLLGVLTSTILAAIKIVSGILGNSYALIADGVESVVDVVSSIVVAGSLKIAASPPNERFPYGYGKVESLAGLVVAVMLLVAAVGIAIQSVREILTPHHLPAPFTLVVLIVVIVVKEIMFRVLSRTGRSIGSRAMETDAWHHRSDALTSLAAFVGISIALLAGEGYESADDWAALAACTVIGYNGSRLFRFALADVLDAAPPPEFEREIRALAATVDDVHGVEKCNIRRSGLGLYVELHVEVNGTLTVRRGHEIAHDVKERLRASNPEILDTIVHVEPALEP